MADFIQSWAYVFIIIAFILGWIAGFLLAIIIASSSKASRMEETLIFKSKDVQPYKDFDDKKDTHMIATQGKPEDA